MTEPQTEAGLVHDAQVALVSAIEKRTWEAAGGIMVPGGGPVNEAIRAFRRAIEAEMLDKVAAAVGRFRTYPFQEAPYGDKPHDMVLRSAVLTAIEDIRKEASE